MTTSRGKAVQAGVRVKLPSGTTWDQLAAMSPADIKSKDLWPAGFYPLPHPHHEAGGMVFPKSTIDEIKKQTGRDLTRFDLDFDLPDHMVAEFPPAIFLTTRPDLGDVSKGQLVTTANFYELFKDCLNPKQLDGLRLLVTPFPQQQFNATDDRALDGGSLGVSCFDCHVNGHTNAATHTVGDIRPNEHRHRIDTPSLRGVNIQRLFGSQRALKTIEDFTEFEQRAAYFDGDPNDGGQEGNQSPRSRQPGPSHGRVPGAPRLPAGPEAGHPRQARQIQSCEADSAAKPCSMAKPSAPLSPGLDPHMPGDVRYLI